MIEHRRKPINQPTKATPNKEIAHRLAIEKAAARLENPRNFREENGARRYMMDAAKQHHGVDAGVREGNARRIALYENRVGMRAPSNGPLEHAFGKIDADVAHDLPPEKFQRFATATAQFDNRTKRFASGRIEKALIEIGHVLLGMGVAEVGRISIGDAVKMHPLYLGRGRKRRLSKERNAGFDGVSMPTIRGREGLAVDMKPTVGDRTAENVEKPFGPFLAQRDSMGFHGLSRSDLFMDHCHDRNSKRRA